jgi:hypothetical protein
MFERSLALVAAPGRFVGQALLPVALLFRKACSINTLKAGLEARPTCSRGAVAGLEARPTGLPSS